MYKISTLFVLAQLLCGTINVYAAEAKSNLQNTEILPKISTIRMSSNDSTVKTNQIAYNIRQEEEKVESLRRITDVMNKKARLFGATSMLLETVMKSDLLINQYGSGQSKIITMGDTTSLRYDFTVLLAEKFRSGKFGQSPLLTTSGTVFRNEDTDYSHLAEFHQFEFDKFLQTSLKKDRELHPNEPSKYMKDDVETLEFAIDVLEELKIPFKIRLNHREMVWYMAELLKMNAVDFQNALDVFDKSTNKKQSILDFISAPGIREIFQDVPRELLSLLHWNASLRDSPESFISLLLKHHRGKKQVEKSLLELQTILSLLPPEKAKYIMLDLTLTRGANYYDGAIFEIIMPTERGLGIGALFGGGRFKIKDALTGEESFGVGAAFGMERVLLALKEMKITKAPEKRIAVIGENANLLLDYARQLRTSGLSVSTFSTPNEDLNNFELILQIMQDGNLGMPTMKSSITQMQQILPMLLHSTL